MKNLKHRNELYYLIGGYTIFYLYLKICISKVSLPVLDKLKSLIQNTALFNTNDKNVASKYYQFFIFNDIYSGFEIFSLVFNFLKKKKKKKRKAKYSACFSFSIFIGKLKTICQNTYDLIFQ